MRYWLNLNACYVRSSILKNRPINAMQKPNAYLKIRLFFFLAIKIGFFLQLYFFTNIAVLCFFHLESTAFERSQVWSHLLVATPWRQNYIKYEEISQSLKRAVIASEDGAFTDHGGLDWDALEHAAQKNAAAEAKMEKLNKRKSITDKPATVQIKIIGGSTITQQLAKNLYLSGERSLFRKGQELFITYMLESILSKKKILELYLNHVEWGAAIFGAQAAALHYYHKNASQLNAAESARLAVMLPRPRFFEKKPNSAWLNKRSHIIQGRMAHVALP